MVVKHAGCHSIASADARDKYIKNGYQMRQIALALMPVLEMHGAIGR